jgi:hypothetical protein
MGSSIQGFRLQLCIYFSFPPRMKHIPPVLFFFNQSAPPRWCLHLIVVRMFAYASDPESYTSGSVATCIADSGCASAALAI